MRERDTRWMSELASLVFHVRGVYGVLGLRRLSSCCVVVEVCLGEVGWTALPSLVDLVERFIMRATALLNRGRDGSMRSTVHCSVIFWSLNSV